MGIIRRQIRNATQELIMPRYDDLPRLGLYLEQVIRYLNQTFDGLAPLRISTGTVSSYVKRGLVGHPHQRRYDRDQLAALIFMAACRRVATFDDLHFLLRVQAQKHDLAAAYDYFCARLEEDYQYVFGLRPDLAPIGTDDSDEKAALDKLLWMVSCQLYWQSYLDQARQNHNS
ncbi:DUF1836 domain-containing protein [Limosilactobacillus antri]|uniref:DUF1836 domain-containing protein n=1 Tax=Limosilactobacillus antri TaxID=227943 RepID=UPI001F562943|nr:DUF1836 domain-containing protein [Limosilactobacillus antri]